MSMRITTNTNLIAEPIFPTYTFSGNIELPASILDSLLDEINSMNLNIYNWGKSGWNFDFNETWYLTPMISRFAPLITRQFFDAFTTHSGYDTRADLYYHNDKRFQFEVRRIFPIIITPGHDFPIQSRLSFYSGITILKCSERSHRPYIQDLDNRYRMNDPIRCWIPQPTQQIFIPDSQPWGISSGNDNTPTVALITHILRKAV